MHKVSLRELTTTYFRQNGYKLEGDPLLEGFSGLPRKFDLLIRKGREKHVVWIKDWKRTVGVNMVINIDRASEDVGLANPILVSQKFSGHAKAYANRRSITLLTKRHIIRRLG